MAFATNHILKLKNDGKLEEALDLALDVLDRYYIFKEENKEHLSKDFEGKIGIWPKRNLAHLYHDLAEKAFFNTEFDSGIKYLSDFQKLNLPESESLIYDRFASLIGKVCFLLIKVGGINDSTGIEIFRIQKDFFYTKPHKAYSFLLRGFIFLYKNELLDFSELIEWWNLSNFSESDFKPSITSEGNRMPSLADYIIKIGYEYWALHLEGNPNNCTQKFEKFDSLVNSIINSRTDFNGILQLRAKALLVCNSQKSMVSFYQLLRSCENEDWVEVLLEKARPDIYASDKVDKLQFSDNKSGDVWHRNLALHPEWRNVNIEVIFVRPIRGIGFFRELESGKCGFFKYKRFLKKISIGDSLDLVYLSVQKNGLYNVTDCKHVESLKLLKVQ